MKSSVLFQQSATLCRAFALVVCCILFVYCDRIYAQGGVTSLPTVEVIGTVPLSGTGIPIDRVPANVQSATARDLTLRQAVDLTDFMERAFDSVQLSGSQGNPFQMDLSFRGYSASPLLGTPQGVSVFVDGVRVNESFGDVVNWDLIPRGAISRVTLIPGSNPVFGLNTLGGALAIETKSGFDAPSYAVRAGGGSFGRLSAEAEYGAHGERFAQFVAVNRLTERGWRDHSVSDIQQLFAKSSFREGRTRFDVSLTAADNTLNGIQALPLSMLPDRQRAYTSPDRTTNELAFLSARANHALSDGLVLDANLYGRQMKTSGFFSNVNDNFDPALPPGAGNSPGLNNVNDIDQRSAGGALQLTLSGALAGRENQVSVGVSVDSGRSVFRSQQQEALFGPDRGTAAIGAFVPSTDVATRNEYSGFYLSDTLALTTDLHLTLSGRFNHAIIRIADRSGALPALNGSHHFARFDPGVGVTFSPVSRAVLYAAYQRGMRAPTPAELTCADPAAPCRLPNAFLADPPLQAVLAQTWETGFRFSAADWRMRGALFRSVLDDDIQFVAATQTVNSGFFQNVGQTRRQGGELSGGLDVRPFTLSASYSYIDATYRSRFALPSPNNSSAIDADGDGIPDIIQVARGNRIPGIPRHTLKGRVAYAPGETMLWGLNLVFASSQYARGDENNSDSAGPVPGYAVWHLDARYGLQRGWHLLGKINNVFNRRYETFGQLGSNFFRGPGNTFDAALAVPEQFRSPAAPRSAWLALEYRYAARGLP